MRGMNVLETLGALLRDPMTLIEEASGLGEGELERLLPESTAATVAGLAAIYAAPSPMSRMQAECVSAIRANGHCLDALVAIEAVARRVADKRKKWRLRRELCRMKAAPAELKRRGLALLKTLVAPRALTLGVSVRRYADNTWSMRVNAPAEVIAQLYDPVKDADDPVAALHEAITGGGAVATVLRPIVTIPLDALDAVLDGTGDETVLRCSDGVERTSTQVARMKLDEKWGFALIHPVEGPVDLVRSERFANGKQRVLAAVENPTCAWDGCNKPADECQVHHLVPWQFGGHTRSSNLATCCAYHNGVNDDDPTGPSVRGRLERVDGKVRRVFRS